jgi:transcriptional regulator GlxA family with amidase domain
LVETDESVENIGTSVGYDDHTYFARRFREHPRGDPAAWRLANRRVCRLLVGRKSAVRAC